MSQNPSGQLYNVNRNRLLEIDRVEDTNEIALFGRALSSPIRIEILRLLNQRQYLLSEIADKLDLQLSSAAFHLKILDEAKLVQVEYSTKRKGTLKFFSYALPKNVVLQIRSPIGHSEAPTQWQTSIGIGDYVDAHFNNSYGYASESALLAENDAPKAFLPERRSAQILWSKHDGDVTYAIPNEYAFKGALESIALSCEMCSETNGYNHDYPSDITFWINGVELCTWTCPGDYGDRYGTLTPRWWYSESTKYGLLVSVVVKEHGVYLNEKLVSRKIGLSDLKLDAFNRTTLRIGIKPDATHKGGFNLFGEKFGDYDQAILFTATYQR